MNQFAFVFERAKQAREDFLAQTNGRMPCHPLSGEDVVTLSEIVKNAGFSANTVSVKILGEFCWMGKSKKRQEFLVRHFDDLMDSRLSMSYRHDSDIISPTSVLSLNNGLLILAEAISRGLSRFLNPGLIPEFN